MKKYINKITRHFRIPKVKYPYKKGLAEKPHNKQQAVIIGTVLIITTSLLAYLFITNTYFVSDMYSQPFRNWLTTTNGKAFIVGYFLVILALILFSIKRTRKYIDRFIHTLGNKLPKRKIKVPSVPLISKVRSRFALRYTPTQTQKRKKRIMYVVWVILLLTPLVVYTFINQQYAEAGWWDENWQYRIKSTITDPGSGLSNFQVAITLDTSTLISAEKMQSDCKDIRVYDYSHLSLQTYWVEGCNTSATKIWMKHSFSANEAKVFWVYYGNALTSTSEGSDGGEIFGFFDDFDGTSINTNKWTAIDSTGISVSGGQLTATSTTGWLESNTTFDKTNQPVIETRVTNTSMPTNGYDPLSTWLSTSNTWGGLIHPGSTMTLYYRSDASWVSIYDSTTVTDLVVKLVAHSDSTADIYYYNGSNYSTIASSTGISNSVDNEPIRFIRREDDTQTGQAMNAKWHWVRSREYAASEPTASNGSEETGPGPIAYWKFDEGYDYDLNRPITNNEQQINILQKAYSVGVTNTYSPTDNSLGLIEWDADKYSNANVYFEVSFHATSDLSGAFAALFTKSGSQVSGSEVGTNSTSYVRLRSGALNLTDGEQYTVQIKGFDGFWDSGAYLKAARLVVVQSDEEKLTDTSTTIDVSGIEEQTSSTATQVTNPRIFKYDETMYDPAPTASFQAVLKGSQPTIEQQINIIDQEYYINAPGVWLPTDNSLGIVHWDADKYLDSTVYFEAVIGGDQTLSTNWAALYTTAGSQVASSVIQAPGAYARIRSGALTLTDDTDYTVRVNRSSGYSDQYWPTYIKSARLIIVQNNATKITGTETQIELGDNEIISESSYTNLANKKLYYYDSSKYTPAPTAYFEASYRPDIPKIEQSLEILDRYYSINAPSVWLPSDNSLGIVHWDADKYSGTVSVYFEAVIGGDQTLSQNYVGLFDTDGNQVSGSTIYAPNALTLIRSGALTLTDDTNYTVRVSRSGGWPEQYWPTNIRAARLVIVQSDSTKITDTETQIEVGNYQTAITDTSSAELTDPKYYLYDADQFTPSVESSGDASFSASLKIDDSTDTVHAELYNKTGSQIVATASHTGDTDWTLVSVSDIDSDADWDTTNDDEYVVRVYCEDGGSDGCSGNIANAKIVLFQSDVTSGVSELEMVKTYANTLATDADTGYSGQAFYTQHELVNYGTGATANYEATMKTSGGTGYTRMIEYPHGTAISGGEIATTSATYSRVRGVTNLWENLPFTTHDLDIQIRNSATDTTSVSNSWLIVHIDNLPTSGATGSVELYNKTDSTTVTDSEVSTTNLSYTRVISSSITLTTSKEYEVRAKNATLLNAKIILDQTDAGGITALQTFQHQVNSRATDSDATYTSKDHDTLYYPDESVSKTFAGGEFAFYYEATLKTTAGTGYARLYNMSDSSVITNSEVSTSSATYVRERSTDITSNMPQSTNGKNLDTQVKNSATNTTSVSSSWIIVDVTNLSTSGITAYADLYNLTDSTPVSGSEVSTSNTTWTLLKSPSITLTTDKEYVVRFRTSQDGVKINSIGAKLTLNQTNADGLTKVETYQQLVSYPSSDSDTGYTDQEFLDQFNPGNYHYGYYTAYYESTLKTNNGANAAYARLKNDTDGTAISGSEVSTTSATYTRARSSVITDALPGAAKNLDAQLKNESTSTTTATSTWLVMQNQNIFPSLAHDSTLNNLNASLGGASWKTESECRSNNCLYFDGIDDYVKVVDEYNNDKLDFEAADDFTLSAWFKHPEKTSGSTTSVIIAKYNQFANGGYKIQMNSDGTVTGGIDDDATSFPEDSVTTTTTYDDNQWHHVAMVKDGTTSLSLYIDGELIGTDNTILATGTLDNAAHLFIGMDSDSTSSPFTGYIDEVKIYPRVRTLDEIKANANVHANVLGVKNEHKLTEDLAIWYKFDEISANTCDDTNDACDSSGNANHARWEDNASSTGGKFASAIDFDGTSDRVATSSANNVPYDTDWWNSSWSKRKKIRIANTNSELIDFQILFSLDQETEMKAGFEDLRFVNSSGTLLKHFIENTPPNKINVWVKVDTLTANNTTDIFMYYGNDSASSVEDRDNTIDTTDLGTYITQYYDANIATNHGASSDRDTNFYISNSGIVNRFNNSWAYQQQYSGLDIYTGLCYDDKNDRFYGIDWNSKQWSTFTTSFTEISPMDQALGDEPIDCATDSTYVYTNHRNGKICRNKISDNTKECINMDTLSGFDWGGQGLTYAYGHLFAGTSASYGANGNRVYMIDISNWSSPSTVTYFDSSGHTLTEVAGLTWKDKSIYQTSRSEDYANEWQGPVKTATNEPTYSIENESPENTQFTVSVWVKADTLGATDRVIIARNNSGSYSWAIYNDSSNPGKLAFTSDGETNTGLSDTTLATGNWYHVTMVTHYNKTKLYINGVLDKEITNNQVLPGVGDISVGADPDGTDGWDGKIDEVRIYKKTLIAKEVEQLFKWAPGSIAYFPLDENTGTTTVYDRSGNNYHGTMNGSMTETDWVQGKIGSALDFDGSNDFIETSHDAGMNFGTGDFTASAWVKTDTTARDAIISKMTTNDGWYLDILNTGYIRAAIEDGAGVNRYRDSTTTVNDNQWHHIAVQFNGTADQLHLYIDGVLSEGTQTNNGDAQNTDSTATLKIGNNLGGAYGDYFPGQIDEVYIYNYARTPEQIIENMNAGHPAPGSPVGSPMGWWKFDEGYGDTAYDSSPQGNNGDLGNYQTCPGHSWCPTWINGGKIDKALNFDGVDNILVVGNVSSLDAAGKTGWSIETWFKPNTTGAGNNNKQIVTKWEAGGYQYIIGFNNNNNNEIIYAVRTGGSGTGGSNQSVISNTNVNDTSKWYHLIGVYDGSTAKIYIDGKLDNSNSGTGVINTGVTSPVVVGAYSSGNGKVNGKIDEVKIYDFALTESQIKTEYNQGKPVVYGATSTDLSGNASWSGEREYCPPGDTTSSCAPIAEWKMDEGTGTNAYDTSANNNTGTISGSIWEKGIDAGWSQTFDGSDDYIDVGTNSSLDVAGGSFTVSAWAKWSASTGNGRAIVDIGSFTNNYALTTGFGDAGQDKVGFAYGSNTWRHNVGSGLNDGKWHYIVGVYDGGTATVYVDGVSKKLNALTYTFDSNNRIGEGGQGNFKGQIDLVRVYNYARTQEQVAWDYNHGKPIGWWKFDECSGNTAYDAGTGGNNATITEPGSGTNNAGVGTCDSGAGDEMWDNGTTGKYNSSLDFDGTDDYMATSGVDIIAEHNTNTKYVSFGAWVKPATSPTSDTMVIKNNEFRLTTTASNQPQCEIYSAVWQTPALATNALPTGTWSHVFCTYDGSDIKIYVNGVVKDTEPETGNILSTNGTSLTVGRNPGDTQYFDGQIDDVRLYNFALTSQQVKTMMNQGSVRYGPVQGSP